MSTKIKDPDAVLDYLWNFGEWLPAGDTISTRTVTASPSGLTVNSTSITAGTDANGNTVASGGVLVWLSAGTAGTSYSVLVRITTANGRTVDHTGTIRCLQT